MRSYANRWAVTPHERVAVFTNNDDGHRAAADLIAKGVKLAAVIDTRADAPAVEGADLFAGAEVIGSKGRLGLETVTVRTQQGFTTDVICGALAVSGGWNPNVHLTCHQRGGPSGTKRWLRLCRVKPFRLACRLRVRRRVRCRLTELWKQGRRAPSKRWPIWAFRLRRVMFQDRGRSG